MQNEDDSLWSARPPDAPSAKTPSSSPRRTSPRRWSELSGVLQAQAALATASSTDRQNLTKYLTIAKLKLENAIAVIRSNEPRN